MISPLLTTAHGHRRKIYVLHDVAYSPDLTLPAVRLGGLTRATGSMPGSHAAECHVGPPEAIKRDWGRRQITLL